MITDISEIEDMGEESGREEAADHYPFVYSPREYRELYRLGRARAQGLYELRGKRARVFAQNWAIGYEANCDMWERDGLLSDDEEDDCA